MGEVPVTLRIALPLANSDGSPISFDDAVAFWASVLRLAAECGWVAEGARCEFDGLEP